jgi:hypothetical protein
MNFRMISGTIDGIMYINMANVKIIKVGEEQGCYCIYLDGEAIPFTEKNKRDETLMDITGYR